MKYRKKPVEINTIQWLGTNFDEIKKLFPTIPLYINRQCYTTGRSGETSYRETIEEELRVDTLEGKMLIKVNDWIVKGVEGEFYPVKPDIFEKTYEKVEENIDGK